MKNVTLIKKAIVVLVLIAIVAGLAGCSTASSSVATSTSTDQYRLVEEPTETVNTVSVRKSTVTALLVDVSASTRAYQQQLNAAADSIKTDAEADGDIVVHWEFSDTNNRDTDLVAALAQASRCDKVILLTDGWQDPADGSAFNALLQTKFVHQDIRFVCIKEGIHSRELVEAIKANQDSFPGSRVVVEFLDNDPAIVVLDNYQEDIYVGTYTDNDTKYYLSIKSSSDDSDIAEDDEDVAATSHHHRNHFPWWGWLLLLLLPLIGLLWWLLSHRKKKEEGSGDEKSSPEQVRGDTGVVTTSVPDPIPENQSSRLAPAPMIPAPQEPTPQQVEQPAQNSTCCCCCRCCCRRCCRQNGGCSKE